MHIVALGSSFAAGPGLKPIANAAAKRSSVNYAHLLARGIAPFHPTYKGMEYVAKRLNEAVENGRK